MVSRSRASDPNLLEQKARNCSSGIGDFRRSKFLKSSGYVHFLDNDDKRQHIQLELFRKPIARTILQVSTDLSLYNLRYNSPTNVFLNKKISRIQGSQVIALISTKSAIEIKPSSEYRNDTSNKLPSKFHQHWTSRSRTTGSSTFGIFSLEILQTQELQFSGQISPFSVS